MLTKLDLCSFALLKLGESPVQSMDDDTASAALSRTMYDPIVDALLAMHPWRFAQKRLTLSKTDDGDFLVPAEVLRVVKNPGELVGDRIYAIGDTITIDAVCKSGPEKFPGYFASVAATKLAMEFCIPLSGDQTVFRMLVALYESELQSAKFMDSTLSPNGGVSDFSLISARY